MESSQCSPAQIYWTFVVHARSHFHDFPVHVYWILCFRVFVSDFIEDAKAFCSHHSVGSLSGGGRRRIQSAGTDPFLCAHAIIVHGPAPASRRLIQQRLEFHRDLNQRDESRRASFRKTKVDTTAKRASPVRPAVLQVRRITAFREPERSCLGGRSLCIEGAAGERCDRGSVKAAYAWQVAIM